MTDFIYDITEFVSLEHKKLVNGYIREANKLLQHHLLNWIPNIVISHCLWYYFHIGCAVVVDYCSLDVQCTDNYNEKPVASFHYLNLRKKLLRGIYDIAFEPPSTIQKYCILPIIDRRDIVVESRAGTGKSAAFAIGILQILNSNISQCQALILSPHPGEITTNWRMINILAEHLDIRCITAYDLLHNESKHDKTQIVCGTPKSMCGILQNDALKVDKLTIIILDLMSEMISSGKLEYVYDIFKYISDNAIQIGVLTRSSSSSPEIMQFKEIFMKKPVIIRAPRELTVYHIAQYYLAVEGEVYKLETVFDLWEEVNIARAVFYVNTRRKAIWLKTKLIEHDMTSDVLHGDMTQQERISVVKRFKNADFCFLITTGLVSKGSPEPQSHVNVVINYDLPPYGENYIHRIQRIGRCRKMECCNRRKQRRIVLNFVTDEEESTLRDIETFYNIRMDELPMEVESIFNCALK